LWIGHGRPALQKRHFLRSTFVGIGLIIRPYFRRGTQATTTVFTFTNSRMP
jgi:hypothetical protein